MTAPVLVVEDLRVSFPNRDGGRTEAVRGVRMQSIDADERINRIVDRILLRRKGRRTDAPGEPESLEDDADSDGGGGEGSGSRTAGTP